MSRLALLGLFIFVVVLMASAFDDALSGDQTAVQTSQAVTSPSR